MYKYNIVLASSDENDDHEVTVINSLFAKQVDGIIFMGYHSDGKNCRIFSYPNSIVLAGTGPEHHYRALTSTIKLPLRDSVTQPAKNNEKVAFVSGPLIDDINGKLRLAG